MSKFGLIPSPKSDKDLMYGSIKAINTSQLPDKFESKPTKIKNQKNRGFCVGFSSSSLKETHELKNHPYENIEISPIFIQHECKKRDGIPHDEGTYISVAMKVLEEIGASEEKYTPLNFDFPIAKPSSQAYENAKRYKIKSHAKLFTKEEIMQAIYNEGASVAAIYVTDSFMYPENGITGLPNGRMYGFHAIKLMGWDKNKTHTFKDGTKLKGFFKFQNSWGLGWGDKGYGWLPFDFLTLPPNDLGFPYFLEAWSSVDIINPNEPVKELTLWIDSIKAIADGRELKLDQSPIVDTQTWRTLVPIKFVSEIFGQKVKWVSEDDRVEIGNNIKLWIGKEYAEVNGKRIKLDQPPIVDSKTWRTLIPLKFVSEVLGYKVQWFESEKKIVITK